MKRKLKIEIGLAVLLLLIALFGSFLAPYDPLKVNYDFSLQPPSFLHIFGTDKLGRDVFSRILCGAKTSFGLTFLMLFLIVFIGMIVGLIAGLSNDKVESFFNNIINGLLAFPDTIFAIAVVGVIGAGLFNTVFALAFVWWPSNDNWCRFFVSGEKEWISLVP